MALIRKKRCSSLWIPDLDGPIIARRGDTRTVRGPGHDVCSGEMFAIGEQGGTRRYDISSWSGCGQGNGEALYTGKAFLWVFLQRSHDDPLKGGREGRNGVPQGRGRSKLVLCRYLDVVSLKRTVAAEPFIDHDPQCVLITFCPWLSLQLFGGHIGDRPGDVLRLLCSGAVIHR